MVDVDPAEPSWEREATFAWENLSKEETTRSARLV